MTRIVSIVALSIGCNTGNNGSDSALLDRQTPETWNYQMSEFIDYDGNVVRSPVPLNCGPTYGEATVYLECQVDGWTTSCDGASIAPSYALYDLCDHNHTYYIDEGVNTCVLEETNGVYDPSATPKVTVSSGVGTLAACMPTGGGWWVCHTTGNGPQTADPAGVTCIGRYLFGSGDVGARYRATYDFGSEYVW